MKTPLKSFTWENYKRALEGLLIMCLGFMFLTGGQFAVQIADSDPHWVPIPKLNQPWVAWIIVWIGFDSIFQNKISDFIFMKIVYPILKPILEPLSQHPTIQKLINKLKKFNKDSEDKEKKEEDGIKESH